MTRNRLTSGISADHIRPYNSLTNSNEQKLFHDSLDIIDLTVMPMPDRAVY